MRAPLERVNPRLLADAARSTLASLSSTVGTDGLAAAAARPGLLALVDQHAAAVRESLNGDHRPLTVAALAGYTEGIHAAARAHDWHPPAGPIDWAAPPDWLLTRLLAVAALARSLDGPRPAPLPPL
ncbi:DUF6401 family natural product biosynthesis protein [Salinispora sp. H7-4]|uniref:DUF6401 family natural product biosynthesis protein n=1 Tax=Salinispora sp. H7-4 TaxID=2748321 RepID=UPI0015D2ECE6|nr:DUF6401 family natural product biosynthesis protein [Salinispora sp. H7-4]NYT95152.1 hypothetical protein [Salinispora sp. H7-4]